MYRVNQPNGIDNFAEWSSERLENLASVMHARNELGYLTRENRVQLDAVLAELDFRGLL